MSDSCDFTAPIKHENEMDHGLAVYVDSHRAVARYTLILKSNFTEKAPFKIIEKGLNFVVALNRRNQLNALRTEKHFGAPCYAIKLENPDEARRAVRIAADKYWAERAASKQPLAA